MCVINNIIIILILKRTISDSVKYLSHYYAILKMYKGRRHVDITLICNSLNNAFLNIVTYTLYLNYVGVSVFVVFMRENSLTWNNIIADLIIYVMSMCIICGIVFMAVGCTHTHTPVSYTHLDVYKRQILCRK